MATQDLLGKTILITGATEGIGKSAARTFATRGATLVIVGRNAQKTNDLRDALVKETGNAGVSALIGDLSSLADVRRVAAEFKAQHRELHVLANNAGALFASYKLTPDGVEQTFALNHLNYFLLTDLLLPVLKATPGARVVSTSSDAHKAGRIDLATIATGDVGVAGWRAYGDSKLANILFTRALAKRLEGTGVVATCFHPGFVATGFGHNNDGLVKRVLGLGQQLFARTPEKGAETLVWLATAPEATSQNGAYFMDKKVARTTRRAKDDGLAEGLWQLSEKLVAARA